MGDHLLILNFVICRFHVVMKGEVIGMLMNSFITYQLCKLVLFFSNNGV